MVLQNHRHSRRRLPKSKDQNRFSISHGTNFPGFGKSRVASKFPGNSLDLVKMLQWPYLMIVVDFAGKRCLMKIISKSKQFFKSWAENWDCGPAFALDLSSWLAALLLEKLRGWDLNHLRAPNINKVKLFKVTVPRAARHNSTETRLVKSKPFE